MRRACLDALVAERAALDLAAIAATTRRRRRSAPGGGGGRGVPTDVLCLRWMSMTCRDSNSLLQWAHLKPNDMGNLFGPSGFPLPAPLPAPRRMLWLDFNLLWISASGPIDANISETGTKHNTKRRIRTPRILCIATDWSVAWMCTHHGLFHNLNEKQPKC